MVKKTILCCVDNKATRLWPCKRTSSRRGALQLFCHPPPLLWCRDFCRALIRVGHPVSPFSFELCFLVTRSITPHTIPKDRGDRRGARAGPTGRARSLLWHVLPLLQADHEVAPGQRLINCMRFHSAPGIAPGSLPLHRLPALPLLPHSCSTTRHPRSPPSVAMWHPFFSTATPVPQQQQRALVSTRTHATFLPAVPAPNVDGCCVQHADALWSTCSCNLTGSITSSHCHQHQHAASITETGPWLSVAGCRRPAAHTRARTAAERRRNGQAQCTTAAPAAVCCDSEPGRTRASQHAAPPCIGSR